MKPNLTLLLFNLKDFPETALTPWNVGAQSPDDFLIHQYHLDPDMVIQKLYEQAERRGGIERLLEIHNRAVPAFVGLIRKQISDGSLHNVCR